MSAAPWTFRAEQDEPGRSEWSDGSDGSDGSVTTGYVVTLHPAEREVVAALVAEVATLLGPDDAGDVAKDGTKDGSKDGTRDEAHPFDASGWSSDPVGAPDDPALRRLFPDAYRDDPQHAAEFRRLTEGDLRATKSARLRTLLAVLGDGADHGADDDRTGPDDVVEVRLAPAQAPEVVAALTDLRLVMAERIGVQTADDADALVELVSRPWDQDEDDPGRSAVRLRATLYLMLGVLQDTLLDAMTGAR